MHCWDSEILYYTPIWRMHWAANGKECYHNAIVYWNCMANCTYCSTWCTVTGTLQCWKEFPLCAVSSFYPSLHCGIIPCWFPDWLCWSEWAVAGCHNRGGHIIVVSYALLSDPLCTQPWHPRQLLMPKVGLLMNNLAVRYLMFCL